jgi:hypothetical protein
MKGRLNAYTTDRYMILMSLGGGRYQNYERVQRLGLGKCIMEPRDAS